MCGIGAIIGKDKQNLSELESLLKPISHRGENQYFNESRDFGNCVMGTNRLAIVGRDTGKQPVESSDGRFACVLNGEIYNFQLLRDELSNKGYTFKTDSDTEVLANGYGEWKEKLLDKIDGMYAFFIFDKESGDCFVARDIIGIKPLYWAQAKETSYFASEIKSLSHLETIKEIKLFPPAHYMLNGELFRYWEVPDVNEGLTNESEVVTRIRELFDSAVKSRVQTDLPLAVYLSGGVDSASVLATALKYHNDVTGIIVGNEESSDRKIALQYCEENNIKYIVTTPPSEDELAKEIEEIVRTTESFEPSMIRQSAISRYIARTAGDFKVILCGEGADELFAGYPEFTLAKTPEDVGQMTREFLRDLNRTQLQRVDRTSMEVTTEVRVPFLDKKLVEYVAQIPTKLKVVREKNDFVTKFILRKAVSDRLPDYILNRKKVVLSEGAGYKGNQRIGGLFYDLINSKVSDDELADYQKKYPVWNIKTKEELYYFKYFLKYSYDKATFNQLRTSVNKIDTLK